MFLKPHISSKPNVLQGLEYWDFYSTSILFTILLIQYCLVNQALDWASSWGALPWLCSADPWCRIAEITDRGINENINKNRPWMILARGKTALLHCTALYGEVCNYIPLNNWNRCPPAITELNVQYNITLYIIYILLAVSLTIISQRLLKCNSPQTMMAPAWPNINFAQSALLAVTQYVFNRLFHLMSADTMICKAAVVICGRERRGEVTLHS